jgi:hypothetical protein
LVQAGSRQEFIATFVTTCSFVKHLDNPAIPENILFSFGKKNPIREQEQRVIDRITQSDRQFRVSTAIDEEKNPDGNFRPASALTSDDLDKVLKEPRTLILIAGGRYQITYNEQSKFSNSQLAILINLPNQERVDAKLPIAMLVAPPGSRFIPDSTVTQQELLGMGWKEQRVGAPANNKVNNSTHKEEQGASDYSTACVIMWERQYMVSWDRLCKISLHVFHEETDQVRIPFGYHRR